jgi:hypothetical protein
MAAEGALLQAPQPEDGFQSKLFAIWDDIGLTAEERASAEAALFAQIQNVYASFIARHTETRDSLRAQIRELSDHCASMVAGLQDNPVEALTAEDNSLRGQLTVHQAAFEQLTAICAERRAEADEVIAALSAIYAQLGIPAQIPPAAPNDLSHDYMTRLRTALTLAENEAIRTRDQLASDAAACHVIFEELGRDPTCIPAEGTALAQAVLTGETAILPLNEAASVRMLLEYLREFKARREAAIMTLGKQIVTLWDQLRVSDADRSAFMASQTSLGPAVVAHCEAELARLRQLRQGMLSELTATVRSDIAKTYANLHSQPADFGAEVPQMLQSSTFTEELLAAHERHLVFLQGRFGLLQEVIALAERCHRISLDETRLADAMNDPNRLTGRRRPGALSLLEEEDIRRRVTREKPRLLKQLSLRLQMLPIEQLPVIFDGTDLVQLAEQAPTSVRGGTANSAAEAPASTTPAAPTTPRIVSGSQTAPRSRTPRTPLTKATGKHSATVGRSAGRSTARPATAAGSVSRAATLRRPKSAAK